MNFTKLYSVGLKDKDYMTLLKVKMREHLLLEGLDLTNLIKLELVDSTKEGTFKLTKKGNKLLNDLTSSLTTPLSESLAKSLMELYERKGYSIGSRKKVQEYTSWFLQETGVPPRVVYKEVETYLMSTESKFVRQLDNLLHKSDNVFTARPQLKYSLLFKRLDEKYGLTNIEYMKKSTLEVGWLRGVGNLAPSKRLPKEYYFTGSYEGDMNHINEIRKIILNKIR